MGEEETWDRPVVAEHLPKAHPQLETTFLISPNDTNDCVISWLTSIVYVK